MRSILYRLVIFIIINIIFPSHEHSFASSQISNRSLVDEDAEDKNNRFYPGFTYDSRIENIKVESQLSLGGEYTKRVREAIERSDQFVVCFMYRFDHPGLIHDLSEKFIQVRDKLSDCIPLVFLDHNPFHKEDAFGGYRSYVRYLSHNVPLSFVRIQKQGNEDKEKAFHHKIIICKRSLDRALIFIGSANATYAAENVHSEDTLIIQSNQLASTLLTQFSDLFKTKHIRIFDENRFNLENRNRKYLDDCIKIVSKKEKFIPPAYSLKYKGSIESLAISNVRPTKKSGDTQKDHCFELIKNNILGTKNNYMLLYFQDFFNIYSDKKLHKNKDDPKDFFSDFRESLNDQTLKLIVRWNDPASGKNKESDSRKKEYYKKLSENDDNKCYFINFLPYTRGKFHHKAIIQYPSEGEPILYTGSFNFSQSAIEKNSETIIGVKSKELVEDYLYSLLWNSSLADHPKIWEFFLKDNENEDVLGLTNQKSKINSLAINVLVRCKNNIEKYKFRLNSCISRLSFLQELNLLSNRSIQIIKDNKDLFNASSENDARKRQLNNIKDAILSSFTLKRSILEKCKTITKNSEGVKDKEQITELNSLLEILKDEHNNTNWVFSVEKLISDIKTKTINNSSKEIKNQIRNVKINKKEILDIINNISDLIIMPDSFSNLVVLYETLSDITNEKHIDVFLEDRVVSEKNSQNIEEESENNRPSLTVSNKKRSITNVKDPKKEQTNLKKKKDSSSKKSKSNKDESISNNDEEMNVENDKQDFSSEDGSSGKSRSNKSSTYNKTEQPSIKAKAKKQSSKEDSNQDPDTESESDQKLKKNNTSPKKQEVKKTKEPI